MYYIIIDTDRSTFISQGGIIMEVVFFEKEIIFDFVQDYLDTRKCNVSVLTDSDIKKITSSKIGWKNKVKLEDFSPLEIREWLKKSYDVRLGRYSAKAGDRTYVFRRKKRVLLFFYI